MSLNKFLNQTTNWNLTNIPTKIINKGIVYNCDCFEYMKTLPDKSIEMIWTSPPFKEDDVDGSFWDMIESFMKEAKRITTKIICVIFSASKEQEWIKRFGYDRKLIWGKGVCQYSWRYNPIFCYQMDSKYNINRRIWCDCFGIEPVQGNVKIHKYQDPLILYKTFISMFSIVDHPDKIKLVLDPFCGSATTIHACNLLGIQSIGCEVDKTNFNNIKQEDE